MTAYRVNQMMIFALALVVGLTVLAPRAARAGDLKKVAIAVAAGVLVYELLGGDHRDGRRCGHYDYGRDRSHYREPCPTYYPRSSRNRWETRYEDYTYGDRPSGSPSGWGQHNRQHPRPVHVRREGYYRDQDGGYDVDVRFREQGRGRSADTRHRNRD